MAVLKCKMCGGQLDIIEDETVVTCEYCGSKQTIPTVDDDKKLKLYERANKLRFNCDFDKAASVYENIISDFSDEAEAYWGLILCTYGIEYVDDPATGKKIPTCHRSSFDSVMDDPNFEMVMENADSIALPLYREQAKEIEEIRKGIIEVSGKEEPYDIFICYKETDENGERTLDSVLAQDVYDVLTGKGYRVFFSRISLEDKLGVEYEPYIFAALNSAKVMLAFGTSYQYYNAVWVKNEWSRYLKLMAKDKSKHLIPCFKNLDAYDMPKEFAKLQAQDLGKVGVVQDLIRGIEKLIPLGKTEEVKETVVIQQAGGNPTSESLLKRAFMFLEDKEWKNANEYCEKVLDIDPENAQAYLGKLMAELEVSKQDNLKACKLPFDDKNNYKKAVRFGNEQLVNLLTESVEYIAERQKEMIYTQALDLISSNPSTSEYLEAAELFESIKEYKDSYEQSEKCREAVEELKVLKVKAKQLMKDIHNSKELNDKKTQVTEELNNVKNQKTSKLDLHIELGKLFEQIKTKKANIKSIDETILKLEIKKSSLGFLAGKQKKEIDQQIITLRNDITKLDSDVNVLDKQCLGYSSLNQIENELYLLDESIQKLEKQQQELESIHVKHESEIIKELENDDEGQKVLALYNDLLADRKRFFVGNTVTLGNYYGNEIDWLVLERDNNKALLISKDAVDCKEFYEVFVNITWETSTLRKWLNEDFYNTAFNDDEKEMIMKTLVHAQKNPEYSTNQGNDTNDHVFLLSIQEAQKYFSSDERRRCKPSKIAENHKVNIANNGCCSWWLRSSGLTQNLVAVVYANGSILKRGNDIINKNTAVRPALWINLDS